MTREFRASCPEDAPAIAELCQRALGVPPESPMFTLRHMQWKYWEPWSEWPGSRSYVLTRDDRIIAHGAVWPLHSRSANARHTWAHLFDWAAEPSAIGSGAVLLRRVASLAAGMIIVGGSSATQRMVVPLGFRKCGEATRYVLRSPNESVVADEGHGIEVVPLSDGGIELEAPRDDKEITFERSACLLRGLATCPVAAFEAFRVVRGGATLGEFVLSFVPFQTRLVAMWCASDSVAERALVVGEAVKRGVVLHPDVDVVAMTSSVSEMRALDAAGFAACGTLPMFVAAAADVAPPAARIRFQMLDGDLAFLHHAVPDPW